MREIIAFQLAACGELRLAETLLDLEAAHLRADDILRGFGLAGRTGTDFDHQLNARAKPPYNRSVVRANLR